MVAVEQMKEKVSHNCALIASPDIEQLVGKGLDRLDAVSRQELRKRVRRDRRNRRKTEVIQWSTAIPCNKTRNKSYHLCR